MKYEKKYKQISLIHKMEMLEHRTWVVDFFLQQF